MLQICDVNLIDHPSQICEASRDNNEVICSNPTPTNLSYRTLDDGFHVEGNDSMPQQVDNEFVDDQNTISQQFDWSE